MLIPILILVGAMSLTWIGVQLLSYILHSEAIEARGVLLMLSELIIGGLLILHYSLPIVMKS